MATAGETIVSAAMVEEDITAESAAALIQAIQAA
jgi:hypothetical protein